MWTIKQLKTNAKTKLKVYYWSGFLVTLIYSFIGGGGSGFGSSFGSSLSSMETTNPTFEYSNEISTTLILLIIMLVIVGLVLGTVFVVFLVNPIAVGVKRYFLKSGEQKTDISEILFAFKKGSYLNVVKIMFLKDLYVMLWTLLFIIPGIIKSYEYYMIPYLLAEDPTMDSKQVFQLSWEMTNGDKLHIFGLEWSFFGWLLLGVMACGIGILFVAPYQEATFTELFLALKAKVYYNRQGGRRQEMELVDDRETEQKQDYTTPEM